MEGGLKRVLIVTLNVFLLSVFFTSNTHAQEYTYDEIAKRFSSSALSSQQQNNAKMQGECLVGLKQLNYRKQNVFDPIAEWSSFRTISLLEQFPPCEVLIMMEVAQGKIRALDAEQQQ